MISSLRGTVIALGQAHAVIDIGGVGMRVEVTHSCAMSLSLGQNVTLHTHLVVREDSLTLFGFAGEDELQMFALLNSVSGVGPRSALGILSTLSPSRIVDAVRAENDHPFKQVSGIGPKSAKLIVVSLQGKVDGFVTGQDEHPAQTAGNLAHSTVVQALMSLGWSETASAEAVQSAQHAGVAADESELLRAALLLLQSVSGRR